MLHEERISVNIIRRAVLFMLCGGDGQVEFQEDGAVGGVGYVCRNLGFFYRGHQFPADHEVVDAESLIVEAIFGIVLKEVGVVFAGGVQQAVGVN